MMYNQNSEKGMVLARLNITIPQETKRKLEELAESEHRSQSNMITKLIEDEYKTLKEKSE